MHCFGMMLMVLMVALPVLSGWTGSKKSAATPPASTDTEPR